MKKKTKIGGKFFIKGSRGFNKAKHRDKLKLDKEKEETEQKCRRCGCTESRPCEGFCYWVQRNLCSACVEPGYKARTKKL